MFLDFREDLLLLIDSIGDKRILPADLVFEEHDLPVLPVHELFEAVDKHVENASCLIEAPQALAEILQTQQ